VENLGVVGPPYKRVRGSREDMPVEKTDLELAEDGVGGEDDVHCQRREKQ
jgi:hypothetical protein